MNRTALYLRVSTKEQTVATQERELRGWAERLGLEVIRVYADTASGARADRGALAEVLAGAHRREFNVLLVWALDRLSREGIGPMARYLDELRRLGIRVQSHQESWLDSGGPAGELLLAVFAWVAQQERRRLGERVRAGMARARAQGTRSGRPIGRPARTVDQEEVSRRREAGQSWRGSPGR
jgi:putative DNA-invertase from lambdoid prophage Rac